MQAILQTYYQYLYKPVLRMYLKTDSTTRIGWFKLRVFKEVFHPKFFFSSGYFYDFLKTKDLKDKQFLEIGCGSGILSLLATRKQALVTAIDIDPKAVENTKVNFEINFRDKAGRYRIIQSDVFSQLEKETFDVIAINPPYYFKKVNVNTELAWYCGENGEYFTKLFSGLKDFMDGSTQVYMILAENAEIERIKEMATLHGIHFTLVNQRKIRFEISYIFQLKGVN